MPKKVNDVVAKSLALSGAWRRRSAGEYGDLNSPSNYFTPRFDFGPRFARPPLNALGLARNDI